MKAANTVKLLALIAVVLLCCRVSSSWAYPDEVKFSFTATGGSGELAITPNGRYLAVLPESGTSVTIVDTSYFSSVVTFSLPATPTGIAAASDSSGFYVTTNVSDGLFKLDLIGLPADFVANQFDLTIDDIFIDVEVIGTLLLLLDDDESTVHVFDADLETINESDSFTLSFNSGRLRHFENLSRALALGEDGRIGTINTSSLNQVGNVLDLSSFTNGSTNLFQTLAGGVGQTITVGFAANSTTPGEIVAFTVSTDSTPITVIDADPTTTERDPIAVADTPLAMLFTEVDEPEDSELTTDFYLYAASSEENTLSVIATEEFFDSDDDLVTPFTTLTLTSSPVANGLTGNISMDGYVYVATSGGSINVITSNPQVTFTTAAPNEVSSSNFTFGFTPDVGGNYQVRLNDLNENGAINTSTGTLLASGSASADIETIVTIDVEDLVEGDNLIHVFVGDKGRNGFVITASPPPATPEGFKLKFGDQRIFVEFRSVEGDVESYNIHFGSSPTSLTGVSGLVSPVSVEHPEEANQLITEVLEPIANGQTVYVQVAAVNSAGEEGEPTEILSETTEETVGLLDLLGEDGGCSYMTTGSRSLPAVLTLLLLVGVLLRIRQRAGEFSS